MYAFPWVLICDQAENILQDLLCFPVLFIAVFSLQDLAVVHGFSEEQIVLGRFGALSCPVRLFVKLHVLCEIVLDGCVFVHSVACASLLLLATRLSFEIGSFANDFDPFAALESEEDLRAVRQDVRELLSRGVKCSIGVAFEYCTSDLCYGLALPCTGISSYSL